MEETIDPPHAHRDGEQQKLIRLKFGLLLLITLVMVTLVMRHTHNVNGPMHWKWLWRHLPSWPLYGLMAAAAVPFFAGQWLFHRTGRAGWALALVVMSTCCLQWAALSQQPHSDGRTRIEEIVDNGVNTSYYSAAKVLWEQQQQGIRTYDWMSAFPDLMEHYMMGHAKFKPPGLILYYMFWINLFGPTALARSLGGYGVGVIGALGVAAIYRLIHTITGDKRSGFFGASFLGFIPSLVLFLPQFDQAYVPIGSLLLLLWLLALRTAKPLYGFAFGLTLAIGLFGTYTFLMLGVFLAVSTILHMGDRGWQGVETVIRQGICTVLAISGFYLLLWFFTGFNAIEVYRTAFRLQQWDSVQYARPWPFHMLTDPFDIALGTGWISVPLVAFGTVRLFRERFRQDPRWRLAWVGLLQIAMALAVAVFPGENARILMVLMPLLMLPIGAELSRWPAIYRLGTYVMLWVILTVIAQNMVFLRMPIDNAVIEPWSTDRTPIHVVPPEILPGLTAAATASARIEHRG